VSAPTSTLQDEFTRALEDHLAGGEEAALLSAYDLGRKALAAGLGVLDVATLLHNALISVCLRQPDEAARLVREAENFGLECLSSFEMTYRAVREANTALRGLNDLLEEQTRRISRELHDQAGQMLATVYIALDDLARDLSPEAVSRLQTVKGLLDKVEEQIRLVSHELRPMILDDLGLLAALELLRDRVAARTGLVVRVDGPRDARYPGPIETVLYRIAQEALSNTAKHARAASVTVELLEDPGQLCFTVRDDGIGFDASTILAAGGNRGIGLLAIRERLAPLGGVLRVSSAPGQGTELVVVVPLARDGSGKPQVIRRGDLGPSPD
jgi:signal transduction histidine kinase